MKFLSAKFKLEIGKDNTKLYPLVIIDPGSFNPVYLSTNSVTKPVDDLEGGEAPYFAPLVKTIKSLRSSINIKEYNYKIKNAGIYITDREFEGKKFSDLMQTNTVPLQSRMINVNVLIYLTTDSLTLQ